MARPKGSGSALGDLPVDPLVEILSRVPAMSVCRFKCVSKPWRDLIADPEHQKKLPQAMEGLFCKTYGKSFREYSFSFINLRPRSVPLDIDPSFSFLPELPETQRLILMDSCNGLILFAYHQYLDPFAYIVCNPTTKEWEAIPPLGDYLHETYTYLAFDPAVSSHFNLVQFELDEGDFFSVHAYSSETGAWNHDQADEQGEEGQLEGWHHRVSLTFMIRKLSRVPFVNGFLHLLVWDQDGQLKIVAVDVQGKARRMIPVPHSPDRRRRMCCFGESQGKLHYMIREEVEAYEGKFKLSIWVLHGYDTKEWVLKHTVDTHEVFGKDFEVLDIHQDCNVVFLTQPLRHKLVAYGMSNKEVTVIATFDNQRKLSDTTARYVPCFQESSVLTNKH